MKYFIVSVMIAIVAMAVTVKADAKQRLGGAKSTGMQRESVQKDAGTAPRSNTANPSTPPSQASPASSAAGAVTMPAKPGMSRWLGPLAGLAAGGLLASMLMGHGFDGIKFMDIALIAMLAFGGFMLFRLFMRKRAEQNGRNSNSGGVNVIPYAPSPSMSAAASRTAFGALAMPDAIGDRLVAPEIGSRLVGNASMAEIESATANPRIPADFEIAPFERQAHSAFIRLQAANDEKDIADIRDFTTPEMYAELTLQIQERGNAAQITEVVTLVVQVLEVATESDRAIASVRYTGTIREEKSALPEAFDEVWHVVKNLLDAKSTWRLAGIQQLA